MLVLMLVVALVSRWVVRVLLVGARLSAVVLTPVPSTMPWVVRVLLAAARLSAVAPTPVPSTSR
ncbi:hypothetical protein L835_2074 [Mycobacteroides abscessus MAB_110811_1470]|nr:hypothetical protein L835_2074 [Mycobacteroides abscessus MAB_110811_1470]